ncbi:MAG: adenylosuccinate synthase [Candidatus Edwardsbacteria bacterium]|nr:adenylosuccinate synthase [Candidatus Edwardsbacteria bacterium]
MPVNKNICVVGAQWGDEGKGKIVDMLAERADVVARYQGGANAGHTVRVGAKEFVLHLVPSGIVHPRTTCVIGNGVVVDPKALLDELALIKRQGIDAGGRLFISAQAHVTLPYHRLLDQAHESQRGGAIGTTHRGIGPTYADKMARTGIRMADLLEFKRFEQKLQRNFTEKNFLLQHYYRSQSGSIYEILEAYLAYAKLLRPHVTDTALLLAGLMAKGRTVLFEGAQGTFLDIDYGTYPYVTSSSTIAGGAATGTGVGPGMVGSVLLVAKAYTTRVGNGPFPAEFDAAMSQQLRDKAGDEVGRTTGRPRRCGWLDAVMLKRAVQLNGASSIAVTKLDVLDGFRQLKVCTAYKLRGRTIDAVPWSAEDWAECRPVYATLPGWTESTAGVRSFQRLPANARKYLALIEKQAGCRVSIVSVGSDRAATIRRGKI